MCTCAHFPCITSSRGVRLTNVPEDILSHRHAGRATHLLDVTEAIRRFNVRSSGDGKTAMVFAHGFGCDQNMWRYVAPAFEHDYRVVLFDHIGAGGSDLTAYDEEQYTSLDGYADDLLDLARALKSATCWSFSTAITWVGPKQWHR